ncbi:MAG: tail fiber domain-containing protein, partial [Bacteroidetes bacterium]|nr:tail fiber domain-containing protein [Bacteroidota bacterium]
NGTAWAPANDNNTTYSAGAGLSLTGTTFSAADVSPTNEIQTLSLAGSMLSLSNGGGNVNLPAGTPSQWTTAGANIHYNGGKVGIGDATPVATLTVGNGDKFQVDGTEGDLTFKDDGASIQFPNATSSNSPMIYMFESGSSNATRMVISHSPSFPTWGLEYKDTTDIFYLRTNASRRFAFRLSPGYMGIGIEDPAFPIDMQGRIRIRWTGSINNSPGIWFSNQTNTFDRAFLGMSKPDSTVGIYSQHLGKWAVEFELMREPRIGVNIKPGSPPRSEIHIMHTNFGGSNDGLRIQNEGPNSHYWNLYSSNSTGALEFYKQGLKRATINPTSGAYTAVSDERLKTEIQPLAEVLYSVLQLKAKTYLFIDSLEDRRYTGFMAQELQKLFPQFVYYGGDNQQFFTVDYAGMSVIALQAIQEQQTLIDQQREELTEQAQLIQTLIQRIEALEGQK